MRDRLVVVAPHPDDEVFAAGGLMRWAWDRGANVEIIAVTDGEGSHAQSSMITPIELVERRAAERAAALNELRLSGVTVRRLGLPDGGVEDRQHDLTSLVAMLIGRDAVVVTPPPEDGHPDHDATGRACLRASTHSGAGCWLTPIWSRVRQSALAPTAVLELEDLHPAKQAAAACYQSQVSPLGPSHLDGPVVHPHELEALVTAAEYIVEVDP